MTTHLTDTQKQTIRIALAKWMGWTDISERFSDISGYAPNESFLKVAPNYPASLDACHEIIRKMCVGIPSLSEPLKVFRDELAKIKGVAWYQSAVLLSTSAEEVSLALFRALNLGELGD